MEATGFVDASGERERGRRGRGLVGEGEGAVELEALHGEAGPAPRLARLPQPHPPIPLRPALPPRMSPARRLPEPYSARRVSRGRSRSRGRPDS